MIHSNQLKADTKGNQDPIVHDKNLRFARTEGTAGQRKENDTDKQVSYYLKTVTF